MRILAVDDEPNILELLKVFLESEGASEVTTASSGKQALQIIEDCEVDFDCILLDIQMPEMNGITLCEKIRALPDYARVPIIMLTAMSQKTYIDKAFTLGATDYVTKPFDFLELRGRMNAAARIVYEYSRAATSADLTRRLIEELGPEMKPQIDEPLSLDGIDRLVGYSAFENFVLALSRTKLLFARAFAIRISHFPALHDALPSRELRALLKTLGKVIVECLPGEGNVVSYRGNGTFLCVNQRKTSLSPEDRIAQIQHALSTATLPAAAAGLQVVVGQEVALASISRSGALLALRKAIDVLERQPMQPAEMAELSRRVLRTNARSQEQSNLERRAYEVLLQDIIKDERRRVS